MFLLIPFFIIFSFLSKSSPRHRRRHLSLAFIVGMITYRSVDLSLCVDMPLRFGPILHLSFMIKLFTFSRFIVYLLLTYFSSPWHAKLT